MPELPEVEAIARTLRPLICGRKIRCAHVFHPILLRPQSISHFDKLAQGARVIDIRRLGKYLFLKLDRGLIEIHFRFDGQLLWFSDACELITRANTKPGGIHVDIALELDKGVLGIVDPRHLGRVHAWPSEIDCPPMNTLGIDALSAEFRLLAFRQLLSKSRHPLKKFLLDQTKIAGIGNIYSCEALWHAQLDPRRPAKSLNAEEIQKLYKAIVSVLGRALECCLDPAPEFHDPHWWFQGLGRILRAYQREGLPCGRCGGPIERMKQDGRSTYCCLHCQR